MHIFQRTMGRWSGCAVVVLAALACCTWQSWLLASVGHGAPARPAVSPAKVSADEHGDRWTFPLDPRCRSLKFISPCTYMAQSEFWYRAPRPGHRAPRNDTERAPRALAEGLLMAEKPVVAFVEMRYLPQVLDLLNTASTAPFVLITAGSDAPLTHELQRRLMKLPGFQACYSTNLHQPPEQLKEIFFPLPVGFLPNRLNAHNEALLERSRAQAAQFAERDARLLVPWMRSWKLRRNYRSVLEKKEFQDLVLVMDRVSFPEYLVRLGRHRCVLSPPGKGYDCTRTWESLAMGSMPLILRDETFDMRIYDKASIRSIPPPEDLTPDCLAELLSDTKATESIDTSHLWVQHWTRLWHQHLDA